MKINTFHSETQDIIRPINTLIDAKFFAFVRFYTDGQCCILANNTEVYEHCLSQHHRLTSDIPEQFINNDFYYYFNQHVHDQRYTQTVTDISEKFGLDSFLDHITIAPDYYDMICYGASRDNPFASTQYLNQMNLLKQFNKDFVKTAAKLIQQSKAQQFILPEANRNQLLMDKSNQYTYQLKFCHNGIIQEINVTPAEYRCALKIASGSPARRIGEELRLSRRTVEFHTNNLKLKFHVNKKSDLVRLLNQCYL